MAKKGRTKGNKICAAVVTIVLSLFIFISFFYLFRN